MSSKKKNKVTIRLPNGKLKNYFLNPNKTTVGQLKEYIFKENPILYEKYQLFGCFRQKRKDVFDDVEGEFFDDNYVLGQYSRLNLELRKKCPETIRVGIPDELSSSLIETLTFPTSLSVKEIITKLSIPKLQQSHKLALVLRKEERNKDENNKEEKGSGDDLQKDAIIPFFPIENIKTRLSSEGIMKQLVRSTNVFGIYLEAEDYPLMNYLSVFMPLGYTKLMIEPKPMLIYLNLPSLPVFPVIVLPIITIKEFSESIRKYYQIKEFLKNNEINYSVFHLVYGEDNDTNETVLTEVLPLTLKKSFLENLVQPNSHIKMIHSNKNSISNIKKESKNKNAHPLINDKVNLWDEIGSKTRNIVWNANNNGNLKNKNENNKNDNNKNDQESKIYNRIQAASLNRTISILTSPKTYSKDLFEIFLETLLLISSDLVLIKFIERYYVPEIHPRTKKQIPQKLSIQVKYFVFEALQTIVEKYKYLVSIKGREFLTEFLQKALENDQNNNKIKKFIKIITDGLGIEYILPKDFTFIDEELEEQKRKEEEEQKRRQLQRERERQKEREREKTLSKKKSKKQLKKNIKTGGFGSQDVLPTIKKPEIFMPKETNIVKLDLMKIHSLEFARQLTLYTFKLFSQIKPTELFDKAWSNQNKELVSPNIIALTEKFDQISALVETEILKESSKKKRIKRIEKIIQIAMHLRQLNNFEDLISIFCGLESAAVSRLRSCWSKISSTYLNWFKKTSEELRLTDSMGLKKIFKQSDLPLIPYIGVFLTDITYIGDLNSRIENGLFNWIKIVKYSGIFKTIKHFQSAQYHFEKINLIQEFFLSYRIMEEGDRWETSLKYEAWKEKD
ncbi:guanine nucleotide exchange factor [Anaeramoeba flamelloides]|uniref:Guanine nucleotide exchange factor n=1 Tax=Anaeramoeba flamelloides TaxID=1746091 RepID=A0AAV7ZGB1_9EUKA|nr:guanine nucleotide exchange factor [Anaeramoeba flamelloides]